MSDEIKITVGVLVSGRVAIVVECPEETRMRRGMRSGEIAGQLRDILVDAGYVGGVREACEWARRLDLSRVHERAFVCST